MSIYEPANQAWEEDLRELRVRLLVALAFIVVITVMGTVGFKIIEPSVGWVRAFFMTAITLTTVGYGQEVPLQTHGDLIFTALLILVGMGGVLYFVSTATAVLIEGRLSHVVRRRRMEKELQSLEGHLIVCGSSQTAVYTAQEFVTVKRPVVFIADSQEAARLASEELPGVPVLVGDPADDDLLIMAGIKRASGMVACTDNDKENLVITLSARQLNPDLRIVSHVRDVDGVEKVRKVGADAVVSPSFIGALRLASELLRPTVVSFLDVMLRNQDRSLRIDEVRVPPGSPAVGRALNQLELEKVPNALILAIRDGDGTWRYNPVRTEVVHADSVLVFLGSPTDARALCEHLEGEMVAVPTA